MTVPTRMSRQRTNLTETTRRTFLGLTAGATASLPLSERAAGASGSYDRVIDVTDHGIDDTGTEPINATLRRLCRNNDRHTLFRFPPGTYAMDEMFRFTDFYNVGFTGYDATVVPTADFDTSAPWLFRFGVLEDPGAVLHFEGFTFDFTAPDTGLRAIEVQVTDGLNVRDVTVRGHHDAGLLGPAMFNVTDPDGWGLVERVRLPDGGAYSANTSGNIARGPTGILVSPYHRGTIRLRDCVVDGFPDNGLYAETPNGRVVVEGGLYRNSNVSNIRVGGDDCVVRGARVEVDTNRPEDDNQRGVRVDAGRDVVVEAVEIELSRPNGYAVSVLNECDSVEIRDCRITVGDRPNSGIVVSPEAGRCLIVNTDVHFDGGGYAVAIFGDDPGEVVCQWMTVSGTATGDGGRSAILCYRDNCEFRDLSVYQPGPNRRAIDVHGDDCLVVFGEYMASTYPIFNTGARTRIYDASADSYGDHEALYAYDGANLEVVRNVLKGGVRERYATFEKFYGNTTS